MYLTLNCNNASGANMRDWQMAVALAAVPLMIGLLPGALAQESIDLEVSTVGGSVLVQFTNISDEAVDRLVVWFESEHTFESHVAEPGWNVRDRPSAVTLSGTLEPGESFRLGVKFEGDEPMLAWQAIADGVEVGRGWILSGSTGEDDGGDDGEQAAISQAGVLPESAFRTIPEKPGAGSVIRLVGSGFGPSQDLELAVGGMRMTTLVTDGSGNFVATRTIPDDLDGRVNFVITDSEDNSVQISLRLEEAPAVAVQQVETALAIDDIEEPYYRGEYLRVSGTARPISTITATAYTPDGSAATALTVEVGHDGSWSLEDRVVIPASMPDGRYVIVASDGFDTVQKSWRVESSEVIALAAAQIVFDPGDPIVFVGTAIPNEDIHFILQDPDGNELGRDSVRVGATGIVQWEHPTSPNSRQGTYTLIAVQGGEQEFAYAGLGGVVEIPVNIVFDKINYRSSDTPRITITGDPRSTVTLLILDRADDVVHQNEAITIQADGRVAYELDLSDISSGVYTAIVQKGISQADYKFGIDLSATAAAMSISTKPDYVPGEPILILGTTDRNVVVTVTLIDPDGRTVQSVTTVVDDSGEFTERRLRVPIGADIGKWSVRAASGPSSDTSELFVQAETGGGLSVFVEERGSHRAIMVTGATGTHVIVKILDGENQVGTDQRPRVTGDGTAQIPWGIRIPGLYTIVVEDGESTATHRYHYDP